MKVNLLCRNENREELEARLKAGGFELSQDSEFILYENNYKLEHIVVRDDDDIVLIEIDDAVMIESYGNDIFVYNTLCRFKAKERIYIFEQMLPIDKFARISQSVIINKKDIKKISPSFGMKFTLTMDNGNVVDVTRSYYQRFKDFIGI